MDTHPYLYTAAAALLSGAAAVFFFLRRRDPGDRLPAGGTLFEKFGPNVRLRDVYRLAAALEEQGEAFYKRLAVKAAKAETQKLCLWLANEEVSHRQFALDQLDRWRALGRHHTEWPQLLARLDQEGFFKKAPGENAAEDELAAYAIAEERRMAEFYAQFETAFPNDWKNGKIRALAEQERDHERLLREQYPHLK